MKRNIFLFFCAYMRTGVLAVIACLVTGCELPPRETWTIIQRDGLLTYWSREYNPVMAPSRYLGSDHRPFVPSTGVQVPYRPRTEQSRYLATAPSPRSRQRSTRQAVAKPQARPEIAQEIPKIPLEPSPSVTESRSKPSTDAAPKPSMADLPYGKAVPGRPGMVNSPYAEKQQLVDVTGMAPGEAVKDPYSGKLFRVPPTEHAAATSTQPTAAPEAVNEGSENP